MRKTLAFVVLALAFAVGACSGVNPTEPTPLPPTPPPALPAQSYVRVIQAFPQDGATLRGGKDMVTATLEEGVSQANLDEAAKNGDTIYATACLSVDGTAPLDGGCFWRKAGGTGQTDHSLSPSTLDNPRVTQTKFILAELRFRHPVGEWFTEQVFASSVFPRTYNWQWQ